MKNCEEVRVLQQAFCAEHRSAYEAVLTNDIAGFAMETVGLTPLHGLRHPRQGSTCGWYLWNGEFSMKADFFKPIHVLHIYDQYPVVRRLLGLEPGFRFLSAGDYLDVWFDPQLRERVEK